MTESEKDFLENYIIELENQGISVHYPPRDTDQSDTNGYFICRENGIAIMESDRVDMFFNPTSRGSFFDAGMGYFFGKLPNIINSDDYPSGSLNPGIEKFLFGRANAISRLNYANLRARLYPAQFLTLTMPYKMTKEVYFEFGMKFAGHLTGKQVILENSDEVQPTEHKSFQNVALYLHQLYLSTQTASFESSPS